MDLEDVLGSSGDQPSFGHAPFNRRNTRPAGLPRGSLYYWFGSVVRRVRARCLRARFPGLTTIHSHSGTMLVLRGARDIRPQLMDCSVKDEKWNDARDLAIATIRYEQFSDLLATSALVLFTHTQGILFTESPAGGRGSLSMRSRSPPDDFDIGHQLALCLRDAHQRKYAYPCSTPWATDTFVRIIREDENKRDPI